MGLQCIIHSVIYQIYIKKVEFHSGMSMFLTCFFVSLALFECLGPSGPGVSLFASEVNGSNGHGYHGWAAFFYCVQPFHLLDLKKLTEVMEKLVHDFIFVL